MLRLLRSEMGVLGQNPHDLRVGAIIEAPDQGCDAATPANTGQVPWLPRNATCWQFKAGEQGERHRIKSEVGKPIPVEYLKRGDAFVLVASGAGNSEAGYQARKTELVRQAKRLRLPTDKINVLTSENLREWCRARPAVAAWLLGRGEDYLPVDHWAANLLHRDTFHATTEQREIIEHIRAALHPTRGTAAHVHLSGHPGIGKTRLALEVCKGADWRDLVAYFSLGMTDTATRVVTQVVNDQEARLVAVIDEVRPAQLRAFNELVQAGEGRVRVLTIGPTGISSPGTAIRPYQMLPLDAEGINRLLSETHPTLPAEHRSFAARRSAGYVKLAKMIADELMANPRVSVTDLLERGIGDELERFLGDVDRDALYVLSVLTAVGWEGASEVEGRAIAEHLGLDWPEVREAARHAHRILGIAPIGNEVRYISPQPLGNYLAIQAWRRYRDQLRTLPDRLPTRQAKDAYYERLEQIVDSPDAQQFTEEELVRFFSLAHFSTEGSAKLWAILALADPVSGAAAIRRALDDASPQQRLALAGDARREVVNALSKLAWHKETFQPATLALANLAAAENEKWANNATGEFVARFAIYLGGTALPYAERVAVLSELLKRRVPEYERLCLQALAKVGDVHHSRFGGPEEQPRPVEPEWKPTSGDEEVAARRIGAVSLLDAVAHAHDANEDVAFEAVSGLVWSFSRMGLGDDLRKLISVLVQRFPETRERIRRQLSDHIETTERKAGPAGGLHALLKSLHDEMIDTSFVGQLRQHVGVATWGRKAPSQAYQTLISTAVVSPGLLREHLAWLTSGEANGAFEFGLLLGAADPNLGLMAVIKERQGRGADLRLHAGYLHAQQGTRGAEWLADFLEQAMADAEPDHELLVQVAWRVGATDRLAQLVLRAFAGPQVPWDRFAAFSYGPWTQALSMDSFSALLAAFLGRPELRAAAGTMLEERLEAHPAETAAHLEALKVVALDPEQITAKRSISTHWAFAAAIVADHAPREVARAILAAHHDTKSWFLEHAHDPVEVLVRCADADPEGVWAEVARYLELDDSTLFAIGFPEHLLRHLPTETILRWVDADPDDRAGVLAHIVPAAFGDDSLASRLLQRYGSSPEVRSALFSSVSRGVSVGPLSGRFAGNVSTMERLAAESSVPEVKQWAREVAETFRRMQKRTEGQEADEAVRRR